MLSLSKLLRVCLTLPADPKGPTRHLPESKCLDGAIELPNSHCAFSGCTWTGSSADDLITQLQQEHRLVLQDSMSALRTKVGKAVGEDETLIASVYKQSIAMAPLASYSIHRRCMQNYVRDIVKDDTCALIDIVCARRFPYISQHKL